MWQPPMPTCAGSSGASRRAQPCRRIRRLALCQPLGRRGQWQGPGRAQQSAGRRDRKAHLQGVSRVACFGASRARSQRRRTCPAASLGRHRHQGPDRVRHPLREGARCTLHGQHHAGRHPRVPHALVAHEEVNMVHLSRFAIESILNSSHAQIGEFIDDVWLNTFCRVNVVVAVSRPADLQFGQSAAVQC
jgi:hypothetical protein